MSEFPDRRDLLRGLAAAAILGDMPAGAAQHVHSMATTEKAATGGVYKPKAFTAAEFKTIQLLCEQIIPGASKGNAAEFIDLLCSEGQELRAHWTGGLAWIDRRMERQFGKSFTAAEAGQQTALLDVIAYRKNSRPETNPGIRFFDLARRMTVDAFYTSVVGIAEIGYKGNGAMTKFQVPKEAIEYALARSPFKQDG